PQQSAAVAQAPPSEAQVSAVVGSVHLPPLQAPGTQQPPPSAAQEPPYGWQAPTAVAQGARQCRVASQVVPAQQSWPGAPQASPSAWQAQTPPLLQEKPVQQ